MNYRIWTLSLLLLLTVGVFNVFSSGDADEVERLEVDAYETQMRPSAVFSHDDHNEKAGLEDDCALCHHVYEDGKLVPDESSEDSTCAECHGLQPTKENHVALTEAFHARCIECHYESARGPVLCGECHAKN
ncbi:MAG: cytochrome c family protein [Desulfobacterales bacterium]|nr:cytochrome c family protein [Desulfobacterales bacterium]